jgi:hypothetical protein
MGAHYQERAQLDLVEWLARRSRCCDPQTSLGQNQTGIGINAATPTTVATAGPLTLDGTNDVFITVSFELNATAS